MIAGRNSEDYYPLTWVGRFPVYLTTVLVGVHVLAMIGVAIASAASGASPTALNPLLEPLLFSGERVLKDFAIWQFVSYAFVNVPSIWFVIEMALLLMFGREVEKFLGRKAFIWLYLALLLAIPTMLTALAVFGIPTLYWGSSAIHFAIFIAFVIIHPEAEIFFSIQAKWIALILLGINSLQSIAITDWLSLGVLWMECACAFLMLRLGGVRGIDLPVIHWRRENPAAPARLREPRERRAIPERDPCDSIDPLLDKISRQGIGSLTRRERERLEKARAALIERERSDR